MNSRLVWFALGAGAVIAWHKFGKAIPGGKS